MIHHYTFIQISLVFTFFFSRIQSRAPHYIWLSCLCRIPFPVTESQTLYFWWPWQFWGLLIGYFVECPSIGICLMFFSWLEWDCGFLEEKHRGNMSLSSLHIKDTCNQDDIIFDVWGYICKIYQLENYSLSLVHTLFMNPYSCPKRAYIMSSKHLNSVESRSTF